MLDAICKEEGLEPGEEEIEKQIQEQAKSYGQDVEDFKRGLTDDQKEYLKDSAAVEMALDLMLREGTVKEKQPEAPEEKPEEAAEDKAEEKAE